MINKNDLKPGLVVEFLDLHKKSVGDFAMVLEIMPRPAPYTEPLVKFFHVITQRHANQWKLQKGAIHNSITLDGFCERAIYLVL